MARSRDPGAETRDHRLSRCYSRQVGPQLTEPADEAPRTDFQLALCRESDRDHSSIGDPAGAGSINVGPVVPGVVPVIKAGAQDAATCGVNRSANKTLACGLRAPRLPPWA